MSTGTSSNALGGNPSHLPNEQAPIDEGPLLDLPSGGDTLVRAADAPRYVGIAAQTGHAHGGAIVSIFRHAIGRRIVVDQDDRIVDIGDGNAEGLACQLVAGGVFDGVAETVTAGVAAVVTVNHRTVDNVLLGEGIVGTGGPGTAVNAQAAVGDITDGVDQ